MSKNLGVEAARTLNRRFRARVLYRRKRDRKVAVDLMGREFELQLQDELTGLPYWVRMRIVRYDPEIAMMTMAIKGRKEDWKDTVAWTTDEFRARRRNGKLRDA